MKRGKMKPRNKERRVIEREVFDWGVRLTARPFSGVEHEALTIRSEIGLHRPGRGCEIRIMFPGVSLQNPLKLLDAQAWAEAMNAVIAETRAVQVEMRTGGGKKP